MKEKSSLVDLFVEIIVILFILSVGVYGISYLLPVLFPQMGVSK